jgi:hypothetical protein
MTNIIPLFPPKVEAPKIAVPAKCSFCLQEAPAGKYINDGQKDSPVICFNCVALATQKLKEAGIE